EPRHGLPSFRQVLVAVAEAWRDRREDVERSGGELAAHLASGAAVQPGSAALDDELLGAAERGIPPSFDPRFGGFERAPKFPPSSLLEFLLRRGEEPMTRATLD